jgi:hypothetical protein
MSNYITTIMIFLIILLIYLHFRTHLKKIHTTNTFYVDNASKTQFDNTCNYLQPFIYNYSINPEEKNYNFKYLQANFENYDIKIYNDTNDTNDTNEYQVKNFKNIEISNINGKHINDLSSNNDLSLNNGLVDSFISYNNEEFLKDSDLYNTINNNDAYLRPKYCNWSNYDIVFGRNNVTPLFSSKCNRNYFHCTENEVECAIVSFKYKELFDVKTDNYQNTAHIPIFDSDIINNHKQWKKIKPIFVTLKIGDCLYLPPFWFCSFKFKEKSTIIKYNYSTLMNSTVFIKDKIINYINNLL